jgi:RNA polymerase sigma-70 factor (ECF subfamily)
MCAVHARESHERSKGFIVPKSLSQKAVPRSIPQSPHDAVEDRRMVARARAGDRRALEYVARRISGSLYRFSRGFCRDPHDAEDVMQDVLVALLSSLRNFRGDASLSSWAYVIARNACARRRRRARPASLERDDVAAMRSIRDPGAEPDRATEREELRKALEDAIADLPASLRDVLVLRDVEGLDAARVAAELGLSEAAVKSRLHRARLRLRESLAAHMERSPREGTCPDLSRRFSRYLEGDLDAGSCASLEQHLARCHDCDEKCSELRTALKACAAWKNAPVPSAIRDGVRAALRAGLPPR